MNGYSKKNENIHLEKHTTKYIKYILPEVYAPGHNDTENYLAWTPHDLVKCQLQGPVKL